MTALNTMIVNAGYATKNDLPSSYSRDERKLYQRIISIIDSYFASEPQTAEALREKNKVGTEREEKMRVLLVEPNYKNKYPPMGLMKISTYHKMLGDEVRFVKGVDPNVDAAVWDRIYITTLFTFDFSISCRNDSALYAAR